MLDTIEARFRRLLPPVDFCSLRVSRETTEKLKVRQGVAQPAHSIEDGGLMVTVMHQGGLGYAATADSSDSGLKAAIDKAMAWADATRRAGVTDFSAVSMPAAQGEYASPVERDFSLFSLADKIELLQREAAQCKIDDRIVDWQATLDTTRSEQLYLTNHGARIQQRFSYLLPDIKVTANHGVETQTRSFGGHQSYSRQGGLELLQRIGFANQGRRLAEEALQLLAAPNCPAERMDLLLAPDQMLLQIHESIGHPLELDRILGDERNYAGTSFVSLDMFGNYQYGSDLLNVTYDPSRAEQFASYGFDDDGLPAEKVFLIRDGLLLRPLGGVISQARSGMAGVANSRACSWNRPPIDRMANLNVEPGSSRLEDMIAAVERGIYMKTNVSWSIDDSRNKFQFGCEWAQLIENGKLAQVVKNPNYRGISATFWRNLKLLGDAQTFDMMGTPYCGKGEPNQVIRVGHASPAALFSQVDVFGGVG
jgi:predicted Zn-dependent protease